MKHIILRCIALLVLLATAQQFCSDMPQAPNFDERKKFYFKDTPGQALTYLLQTSQEHANILFTLRNIASTLYSSSKWRLTWIYAYITTPLQSDDYTTLENITAYADAQGSNHNSPLQKALDTIKDESQKKDALTAYFIAIEQVSNASIFEYAHIWNTLIASLKSKIDNKELYNFLQILFNTNNKSLFDTIAPQNWTTPITQADEILESYNILYNNSKSIDDILTKITGVITQLEIDRTNLQRNITDLQHIPRKNDSCDYQQLLERLNSLVDTSKRLLQMLQEQLAQEKQVQEAAQEAEAARKKADDELKTTTSSATEELKKETTTTASAAEAPEETTTTNTVEEPKEETTTSSTATTPKEQKEAPNTTSTTSNAAEEPKKSELEKTSSTTTSTAKAKEPLEHITKSNKSAKKKSKDKKKIWELIKSIDTEEQELKLAEASTTSAQPEQEPPHDKATPQANTTTTQQPESTPEQQSSTTTPTPSEKEAPQDEADEFLAHNLACVYAVIYYT